MAEQHLPGQVRFDQGGVPHAALRRFDDFGIESLDLVAPPSRFWSDGASAPRAVYQALDERRASPLQSPAALLTSFADGSDTRAGMTKRSIARLHAWFLISEDPQRRLEAREVVTLAHQASLVQHVLQEPSLSRVLIADEVGLGKTIEAGLILQELLRRQPTLRILYLAPARLVGNVHREFRRLGLEFRCFVSQDNTATAGDARVIASIHRAVHPAHFDTFLAEARWDVVVVDECHHLSDWQPGGGSPVRKYKLVDDLLKKLRPGSRVILLSGTPHQGHPSRFENLLKLLTTGDESLEALAGRVVYRTKEDVADWEGRPLFPRRQVNNARVVDLGPTYRSWLGQIHELFEPSSPGRSENAKRAAGWRAGQALQWASSSVEAGLGYLIRQALRQNWDDLPGLLDAAKAVRPYRGGSATESPESVLSRMRKEIGSQLDAGNVEDLEELENGDDAGKGARWRPDRKLLSTLLREGVELARSTGHTKWEVLWDDVLSKVESEKVVLFAQPIETVSALRRFLSLRSADRVSLIVGGQSEEERAREINAFWDPKGPQFLVSSRAGGEGINLQVARHLVHLDVPWNPMELEQRVGRVHRFLSRRTIIVDTLIVKESREVDTYRVAREKLTEIAASLVPPERFDELFSRVMSLVPPEELQGLLAERPHGPLSPDERDRLTSLVTTGFDRWREFDQRYAARQRQIRSLDPGGASWGDVRDFVASHLGGKPAPGFTALIFEHRDGEVHESSSSVEVLSVDSSRWAFGDHGGMPITGPNGERALPIGLNTPFLAEALRKAAFPEEPTGAALVIWPDDPASSRPAPTPFGLVGIVRQTVSRADGTMREGSVQLRLWLVLADAAATEIVGESKARVVRDLVRAKSSSAIAVDKALVSACQAFEREMCTTLRTPSEHEKTERILPAAFPLFACIVK